MFLEWADTPGVISKTLSVGETATINIRLELIAGESWGSANVPLGVGTWLAPDDMPNFEITGFQTDGFIGSSFSYDRSGLPALPMSPEAYRLVTNFDGVAPIDSKMESGYISKIAMWMLDTDHDGRSLYPSQVFFPMAGAKDGWARVAKNLKAEIDEELIAVYRGTVSLAFEIGDHNRVAVKIIDDRGIESLKIVGVG